MSISISTYTYRKENIVLISNQYDDSYMRESVSKFHAACYKQEKKYHTVVLFPIRGEER